jgi:outer membrane protein assembly factor BamB
MLTDEKNRIRWWPAVVLLILDLVALAAIRLWPDLTFQERNIYTAELILLNGPLLGIWWLFFSRAAWKKRFMFCGGVVLLVALAGLMFRITGVSGDLLPIVEWRWKNAPVMLEIPAQLRTRVEDVAGTTGPGFPQFLGPDRNGVLAGPELKTNWVTHAPVLLWKRSVGEAWSGFAVAGRFAVTQEQRDAMECVTSYDLLSGAEIWTHQDTARFDTKIAGIGPRATPTISDDRVLSFGATGLLNCLELASGRLLWSRDLMQESGGKLPDWGFTSAPLVVDGLVIVHGGESGSHSLLAFHVADGARAWATNSLQPSFAAASLVTLAGVPQVLAFNQRMITAHEPATGNLLWSHPWGNGNVVCSSPAQVSENRILFSSGYGYGSELLEVTNNSGALQVTRLWKSNRLKSKFGHLFLGDGCAYGLDDGVLAAIDLVEGSLVWKENRHGHGQGLRVGKLYLLMGESGELILFKPDRTGPNELARLKVFDQKTWNPPALAGNLLLVRNHKEAACFRLATE